MEGVIYFDNAATTRVGEKVLEDMLPFFREHYGNSGSAHSYGWYAKTAVKTARSVLANKLNCEEQELLFNSGATEGINTAIKSIFNLYHKKGNHIIVAKTEHKAVLDVCNFLEKKGAKITYLNVDTNGFVSLDELELAITNQTILVSIMHVNNETGVIQDIEAISNIVHKKGSMFLCDCTQSIGKIDIDLQKVGIDIMPISAHKIYGPKGVGALYFRRKKPRVSLEALLHGGSQERSLRAGTLNVAGVVGLGSAIKHFPKEFNQHCETLKTHLIAFFNSKGFSINGLNTASNILNVRMDGLTASKLMKATSGIAYSLGSACTSEDLKPSHVLRSMHLSEEEAYASFRISLSAFNTLDEVKKACEIFDNALAKIL